MGLLFQAWRGVDRSRDVVTPDLHIGCALDRAHPPLWQLWDGRRRRHSDDAAARDARRNRSTHSVGSRRSAKAAST
jgi:hypothetical protein